MKKVMHLISTDVFSGAENVACQIINGFSKNNDYKMIYVSKLGSNKKCLEDRSIPYYKLDKFNYKCIKKAVQDFKPDIIHAHDIKASIYASLFYKQSKIVSHIHSNHENMRNFNFKPFLYNIVSNRFSKIIWVSKSALNDYYYSNKVQQKSIVLYNVIDSKGISSKANQDKNQYSFDIIYLGRMVYAKNPIRLIKIVNEVIKKRPETTVALVGTGELEQDVRKEIHEYNLEKNITLFGFQENPYKILSSSKIMLMTSRYEGTPMCALEAIACGVPIISTPTDGLKELIESGNDGFICYTDEEMVNTILKTLNDKKILRQLNSNMQNKNKQINNFKQYINSIKTIYESKDVIV